MESSGDADLRTVFGDYCAGQGTMDGKSFAKMCKDNNKLQQMYIEGDRLRRSTSTAIDLIFFIHYYTFIYHI